MTSTTTFAERLAQLSAEELSSIFENASASLNPSPVELIGLVARERIRRHALVCKEYACGFNPVAF